MSGSLAKILKKADNITIDTITANNRRILKESESIYKIIGGFYEKADNVKSTHKKKNKGGMKGKGKKRKHDKKKKTVKKKSNKKGTRTKKMRK